MSDSSFRDELNHLLDMVESEVGEGWQQLRAQAARVRELFEASGVPATDAEAAPVPVGEQPIASAEEPKDD